MSEISLHFRLARDLQGKLILRDERDRFALEFRTVAEVFAYVRGLPVKEAKISIFDSLGQVGVTQITVTCSTGAQTA